MKKTLSLLAVLAVAGVASAPAEAATRYVSGMAGISWFQDSDVTYTTDWTDRYPGYGTTVLGFDSGLTATAAVGCDYGSTRVEAEIGYQKNDIDQLSGEEDAPYFGEDFTGKTSVYSLMLNGYLDIPVGGDVELYAMAGVGAAQVNFEGDAILPYYYGEDSGQGYNVDYDPVKYKSHATTFAYQLGAGIAIPLSKGVKLDARYRYFATTDFTFTGVDDTEPITDGYDWDTAWYTPQLNTSISSHSVLVGLRVDI
jgi:opacity protein-like surface antigen